MTALPPGVTKSGEGLDNISWNILGQTYVPKALSDDAFAWHATFPPDTMVPPHIHPTQDEFVYILGGKMELWLAGVESTAGPGDLLRLTRGVAHGLFNKSGAVLTCLFWVAPTGKLWDLFKAIDGVPDPAEVVRLAGLHEVDFLPPPG